MALSVNDDGIYDQETYSVSCEDALFAGKAAASLKNDIAVGYDPGCGAYFSALTSGILSGGKKIWDTGRCSQAQLRYAIRKSGADTGIFIENCCGNIKLIIYSSSGYQLTRSEENTLSSVLENNTRLPESGGGEFISAGAFSEMYRTELKQLFEKCGEPDIRINSSGRSISKLSPELISNSRTDSTETVSFSVSASGLKASAYSLETGYVFWEKLILICCMDEFEKGYDIALPYSFPVIADRLAAIYNRNIYRYDPYSDNLSDISKKELSLEFPFLSDGLILTARIIRIMQRRCSSLNGLLKEIPDFTTAVKYVNIRNGHEEKMQNIHGISDNDILCRGDTGRIIARKSRSGKSLILYAESYSTETADEFCSSWISSLGLK